MHATENRTTQQPGALNNYAPIKVPFFQPKLTINEPGDQYEEEADRMADHVMRMPANSLSFGKGRGRGEAFFKPSPVSISRLQRKCKDCEDEEKLQRKENEHEEEPIQLKLISDFTIQRKCATCEEEEVGLHRKESGNFSNRTVSPAVEQTLQSTGQPIDRSTRTFMEERIGYDFGHVQIHNDSLSHQSSADINALAYTHGNHVVFGATQYNPNTSDGKKLLAHELTHVVQQERQDVIRRSPGDVGDLDLIEPSNDPEEIIISLLNEYNTLPEALGPLEQVFIISGTTAMLYDIKVNVIATYQVKPPAIQPCILLALPNGKFGILGVVDIKTIDGTSDTKYVVATEGTHNTPDNQRIFDEIDKELTIDDWFLNKRDSSDFKLKGTHAGAAVAILPLTDSGGGKGASQGEAKPPMPAWMEPYKTEMLKLLAATKTKEPLSTDLPDKFSPYYSTRMQNWRATASQVTDDPKKPLQVYFDIAEKDDKNEKLQEIRDKIRMSQLHAPEESSKDAKPVDPQLAWAYILVSETDALIKKEKGDFPSEILPDKIGIAIKEDEPYTPRVQLWLYVTANDTDGNPATSLKTGIMSSPLVQGTKPEDLRDAIKKEALALSGAELKPVSENPHDYKHVLAPFPANIEGLNIGDDYQSVTGAELEMHMDLNMDVIAGMDLLNQTFVKYRGIMYTWDVYRIFDVIPTTELDGMPTDWQDRRKELQGWFKDSGQLKNANPVIKKDPFGQVIAENLQRSDLGVYSPEGLQILRALGYTYGTKTTFDDTSVVNMPVQEDDYVLYCRALAEPGDDIIRLPSEAFFVVRLVDGYKLAKGVRDERTQDLDSLNQQLAAEPDVGKKKDLQEKIDELKKAEQRTLAEGTHYSIDQEEDSIILAEGLIRCYLDSSTRKISIVDAMDDYAITKKLSAEDFAQLVKLHLEIESTDLSKTPFQKLTDLIETAEKNVKSLKDVGARIDKYHKNFNGYEILPAPVVGLISKVTGKAYPLLLTIGIKEDKEYGFTSVLLVDVTTSETEQYEGVSFNSKDKGGLKEAIKDAFEDFGKKCPYGEGYIAYRVPGTDAIDQVASAPGIWERVKSVLITLAEVAAIAALIVGTGGTALGVVAGYAGLGAMAIQAGFAIGDIYDRVENHRDVDIGLAMDILNIAAPVLAGAGAIAKLSELKTVETIISDAEVPAGEIATAERGVINAAALSKLGNLMKIGKTLLIVQKGSAVINLGLIAWKTTKDLQTIAKVYADDPNRLMAAESEILMNALISGTMAMVALKNEFTISNPGELDGFVNSVLKGENYDAAMVKSGLKDVNGNWVDPKLQAYFLGNQEENDSDADEGAKNADESAGQQKDDASPKDSPENEPAESYLKTLPENVKRITKPQMKELILKVGNWKELIKMLKANKRTDLVAKIKAYRSEIIGALMAKYESHIDPNASTKDESDVDVSMKGFDAGKNMIECESKMQEDFGDDWDEALRVNFYTEGERLLMYKNVESESGEQVAASFEKTVTQRTAELSLARMLHHAEGTEIENDINDLIQKLMPEREADIKSLADNYDQQGTQRRNELLTDVDALMKEYSTLEATDTRRIDLAHQITLKQMEANFYTTEANIGPASLQEGALTRPGRVQVVFTNLEMMVHIVSESGGDKVSAAREYETYKYMYRASDAMDLPQKDLFYDYLTRRIKDVNRGDMQTATPGEALAVYHDFMQFIIKYLQDNISVIK